MKTRRRGDHRKRDLLRIAVFILFDALLVHERIAGNGGGFRDLSAVLGNGRRGTTLRNALLAEWEKILAVGYKPVFLLASEVLSGFPASPETEAIVGDLLEQAIHVADSGVLLKHDILGRIYHRLLLGTSGDYYSTFYTGVPSAWLLAGLTFKNDHPGWDLSSLGGVRKLRVLDPACGSGTLLSAAYMAIKDGYLLSRPKRPDLKGLHKTLVEDVLHGWDIMHYAVHLSLTTLAQHSGGTFSKTNLYSLKDGVDEHGNVFLGSLSYLARQMSWLLGSGLDFRDKASRPGLEVEHVERLTPPECDVVIMNPPFVRSANPNVRFGYATEPEKKRMDEELSRLAEESGLTGVGHAGLGAYFVPLADRLLKPQGRMSFVQKRSLLSGTSWRKIRKLLEEGYQLEHVVSCMDAGDRKRGVEPWNWSEHTNLSEVLVVARKLPEDERGGPREPVAFVSLWRKPTNEVESLLLLRQILKGGRRARGKRDPLFRVERGGKSVGGGMLVPQEWLEGGNWLFPCLFAQQRLNGLVVRLARGKVVSDLTPLGLMSGELGTDIKQVKDHFRQEGKDTDFAVLWGHDAAMDAMWLPRRRIASGQPRQGDKSEGFHKKHRSRLLIADRLHVHTDCVTALESPKQVLATAFWEVRLREPRRMPGVLLWLNSTLGLLLYLSVSTNTGDQIFQTKKEQLGRLMIPRLDDGRVRECARFYKKVRFEAFKPFPKEAAENHAGRGLRKKIDDFFIELLGLKLELKPYYRLLAREPILTLKRLS